METFLLYFLYYSSFTIIIPCLLVPAGFRSEDSTHRALALFLPIILIFNLALVYLGQHLGQNNLWLIHIYTIIELNFFTWIFRTVIGKQLAISIMISFSTIASLGILFISDLEAFNPWMSTIESILVILYVLAYFNQTAREMKVVDITREPLFWLSTGALIYFSSSFFLFIFSNYIAPEITQSLIFWGVHALLSILLYTFFFITLWTKSPSS